MQIFMCGMGVVFGKEESIMWGGHNYHVREKVFFNSSHVSSKSR